NSSRAKTRFENGAVKPRFLLRAVSLRILFFRPPGGFSSRRLALPATLIHNRCKGERPALSAESNLSGKYMSGDLEAGGALVTAALAASELEPGEDAKTESGHAATCPNCKAKLAGRFCAQCGQPAHVHRSLLHMGEELLHGLFHFDTKSWRTLPLLIVRPGLLTRRYIDGQRMRYVSPLAMFLFAVFLMC